MKQEWSRVTINLKPLEYRWFRIQSAKEGLSVSAKTRRLIEDYMQKEQKKESNVAK